MIHQSNCNRNKNKHKDIVSKIVKHWCPCRCIQDDETLKDHGGFLEVMNKDDFLLSFVVADAYKLVARKLDKIR